MCVKREREINRVFFCLVPAEAEERQNIRKEWLEQAMEEDWNVLLAHHVTGMGLVNHENTGAIACHMFQIIMNKEWCKIDICLYHF